MHERNIYRKEPNFKYLAEKYLEFAKYVHVGSDERGHLNFKDPEAVRALTYTLLKEDFNLTLEIPLDRLIPTLPLRLNYIHWIEDLINSEPRPAGQIRGIDIGCGASCIYPLLGSSMNGWHFTALDIDDISFDFAAKNIKRNNLNDKIILRKGQKGRVLLKASEDDERFDFCMCNPPFFSDREEAGGGTSRTGRRPQPFSVCTAVARECITEGGEVEFVKKMMEESLELKSKIRWYTSMLGKKKSLVTLKQYFKDQKIPYVSSTSFQQGRTTRWGICWSFQQVTMAQSSQFSKKKAKINTSSFRFCISKSEIERKFHMDTEYIGQTSSLIDSVCSEVSRMLNSLEIMFTKAKISTASLDDQYGHQFTGRAFKNTWSHQRQKKRNAAKINQSGQKQVSIVQMDCQHTADAGIITDNKSSLKTDELELDVNDQDAPCVKIARVGSKSVKDCNHPGRDKTSNGAKFLSDGKTLTTNAAGLRDDISKETVFSPQLTSNQESREAECVEVSYQGTTLYDGQCIEPIGEVVTEIDRRKSNADRSTESLEASDKTRTQQKPSPSETNTCKNEPSCLFEFRLVVKSCANELHENHPVEVNLSCVEGNREGVHQLFMYFRNQFHGIY